MKTKTELIKFDQGLDLESGERLDTFDLIISCIEQIYNDEESWSTSDCTKEEMNDFLDQLNSNQFKEIEKFFDTMPKLSHTLTVNNPNTKVKSDIKLEGLAAFFA